MQLGKETGARAGELFNLTWTDIDFQRKDVSITPEKSFQFVCEKEDLKFFKKRK